MFRISLYVFTYQVAVGFYARAWRFSTVSPIRYKTLWAVLVAMYDRMMHGL